MWRKKTLSACKYRKDIESPRFPVLVLAIRIQTMRLMKHGPLYFMLSEVKYLFVELSHDAYL